MSRLVNYQPQSGSFDISKATINNLSLDNTNISTPTGSTRNLYTRSGRGYVNNILFSSNTQQCGYLQITIDGIIITKLSAFAQNTPVGIVCIQNMRYTTAGLYSIVSGKSDISNPIGAGQPFGKIATEITDGKDSGIIIIPHPLFYKSNLIIDFIGNDSTPIELKLEMMGGVY